MGAVQAHSRELADHALGLLLAVLVTAAGVSGDVGGIYVLSDIDQEGCSGGAEEALGGAE